VTKLPARLFSIFRYTLPKIPASLRSRMKQGDCRDGEFSGDTLLAAERKNFYVDQEEIAQKKKELAKGTFFFEK
jgi:hypothetical protein